MPTFSENSRQKTSAPPPPPTPLYTCATALGTFLVETAHGRGLSAVEIRLVSEQLSDVGDAVLDHRGPL